MSKYPDNLHEHVPRDPTSESIHTCNYYCERPECIKRQRDELRDAAPPADARQEPVAYRYIIEDRGGPSFDRWEYEDLICGGKVPKDIGEHQLLYAAPQPQAAPQEPVAIITVDSPELFLNVDFDFRLTDAGYDKFKGLNGEFPLYAALAALREQGEVVLPPLPDECYKYERLINAMHEWGRLCIATLKAENATLKDRIEQHKMAYQEKP